MSVCLCFYALHACVCDCVYMYANFMYIFVYMLELVHLCMLVWTVCTCTYKHENVMHIGTVVLYIRRFVLCHNKKKAYKKKTTEKSLTIPSWHFGSIDQAPKCFMSNQCFQLVATEISIGKTCSARILQWISHPEGMISLRQSIS